MHHVQHTATYTNDLHTHSMCKKSPKLSQLSFLSFRHFQGANYTYAILYTNYFSQSRAQPHSQLAIDKGFKVPGYTVDRILLVSPILKHATCHQEFILHNLHDLETRLRTAFWWANDSDGLGVSEREREREGERERGREGERERGGEEGRDREGIHERELCIFPRLSPPANSLYQ